MRKLIIGLALCLPLLVMGQNQRTNDIFPKFGNYERKGWVISPSLTYTLRPFKQAQERIFMGSDSIYDVQYNAKGKMGVGIELGRFYAIDRSRLISYIDFSIGLKMLRGVESFEATLDDPDRLNPYILRGEGTFSQSYATASFNATNAKMISREVAMHNTLGFNADYRFADVYEYNMNIFPMDLKTPGSFIFQAHYKLGFGFSLTNNLMLVPSVETPLITLSPYDDLKSTLEIFNSRYRPLIFRLTILVLDNKPDRTCPKTKKRRKSSERLFGSTGGKPW